MEVKKSREADLEGKRLQGFLLGLNLVLALLFVALEWNVDGSDGWRFFEDEEELDAEMELAPLKRDLDEVPMMIPHVEQQEEPQPSTELNLVDEEVELPPPPTPEEMKAEEKPEPKTEEDEQPQAMDMYEAPVDLRVVEDLPQFPGGAVAFMKWLTKNLKYPAVSRNQKRQGRVVAEFIINKDGSISDLQLVEHLDAACDREALRVLRQMPNWTPGMMDAKPCRTKVRIPIVFKL